MAQDLTLIEAQHAGLITHIRGTDSNVGMIIDVRNTSDQEIILSATPGTVIGSRDPNTQRMVIARRAAWRVPPRTAGSIDVDALCMEAYKAPPSRETGPETHVVEGMVDSTDVMTLLTTVEKIESEISASITSVDEDAGTFSRTELDPNVAQLATVSLHSHEPGTTGYKSQLHEHFVQTPLWQLTDGVEMKDLAKIVVQEAPETQQELRQTAQVLAETAKLSAVLLEEAGLSSKQSIAVPSSDLEVLYVEHDVLSNAVSKLRRESLAAGPGGATARSKLTRTVALLHEKEREIRVAPHKDALLRLLAKLPVSDSHKGRSALLNGIRTDSLDRDEGMKLLDLDLIVTQLVRLGRDHTGEVLVLTLIDNALPYAEGFEAHAQLQTLRQEFDADLDESVLPI